MKRTLMYVLGFGLGSLLFVVLMSFTIVSIAEGLLSPNDAASKRAADDADDTDKPATKAGSKARPARANEAPDETDDQPL
jgi:hypothetical protein